MGRFCLELAGSCAGAVTALAPAVQRRQCQLLLTDQSCRSGRVSYGRAHLIPPAVSKPVVSEPCGSSIEVHIHTLRTSQLQLHMVDDRSSKW